MGRGMTELERRIEIMYRRDRLWAWVLVLLLWLTFVAVLVLSWPYLPDGAVRVAVLTGAGAVLVLNTASITAMLRHYAEDKEFIYGLDLQALDAMKAHTSREKAA
jgi:hypothetical protein